MINKNLASPLVSVCIASYNHGKYIKQAIDSVVQQSYTNLEIIIVDNYSTDNTHEVLAEVNDPRIKVIKNRNYGSIAVSRNISVINSNGDWIAFLDSDDWWTLDKLDKCSKYFKEDIDLIYHNLIINYDNLETIKNSKIKSRRLKKPVFKDLLINGNTIATSSVVVRKSILSKVNAMSESKEMFGIEDFNTWLKISQITNGFKLVSKNLGFYRIHNKNISSIEKKIDPPTDAFIQFLPLLTKKEISAMNLNYSYATARINFIEKNGKTNKRDLTNLIKHGSLKNRIKALVMLLISVLRTSNK